MCASIDRSNGPLVAFQSIVASYVISAESSEYAEETAKVIALQFG